MACPCSDGRGRIFLIGEALGYSATSYSFAESMNPSFMNTY